MLNQILSTQCQPTEWLYLSTKSYNDPFNDIELDVILTHADGLSWRVPAYWAGGNEWRIRFAAPRQNSDDLFLYANLALDVAENRCQKY